MESIRPLSGFQLPFQKRLSNLYNDTKKSSDFVKDPIHNEGDPDMKALHRKLRIQKDRLVSWGLEWSDPTQSAAEIDESLSRAGLSEVVGSIMSTTKDILAEAEPLWLSSKQDVQSPRPSPDRKPPLVQWDKGRFEDLVRDLTTSIDTLFDLSRTRSYGVAPRRLSKATYKTAPSAEDFRPFESTRIQTPQQIDPQTLTHLRPMQGQDAGVPSREVVFMSKTAYSELTRGASIKEPWSALLLEYATFDSIFSITGITPPMARFEKISAALQQDPQRAPGTWTGLPRLLGYFEDIENSRIGLVYRFPPSFNAVSFESPRQHPSCKVPTCIASMPTLQDLLSLPDSEPPLEAKFRLAYNLTNTVFDLHARGITHGNLINRNVSFCHRSKDGNVLDEAADVRRPLVSSFHLFDDTSSPQPSSLARHPLADRTVTKSALPRTTDDRVLELYSLAMMLLSIGLWKNLDDLATTQAATGSVPSSALDELAIRCGSLYMKAVQACWNAVDDEVAGRGSGEGLLSSVQVKATRFLEACCILDGVSGFEERLSNELHDGGAKHQHPPASTFKDVRDFKLPLSPPSDVKQLMPLPDSIPEPEMVDPESDDSCVEPAKPEKIRLYPHVPLPPEAVEKWNTILMPQINQALRHFYRKHLESVEISLESVGPSPQNTLPTVVVVCTSAGKVRAILKKRVGDLFDGTTGFDLKVCRGHVVRSRRQARPSFRSNRCCSGDVAKRSAAEKDNEIEAANPGYRQRPRNGASIGAWIGDRHLPPVSFGGLILVDNKPYGMSVHHMLDDPDRDFGNGDSLRSSAIPSRDWCASSTTSSNVDEFAYDLSDTESEPYSETDITSDFGEDHSIGDEDFSEPGDIPGIEPGCGDGYVVTQPALDDVEDGFYPCPETEDDEHLVSFSLGEVYASSGIRRRQANGLVHEVDWALFEFDPQRLPYDNAIPCAQNASTPQQDDGQSLLRPAVVACSNSLPGREVQCMARTSGLQTGQILPALTSVKIYGRTSPSQTFQVASVPSTPSNRSHESSVVPMGIPGDSGAWIVDLRQGQLCGHILAWSQRKQVAYICPMDILMQDIAQSLGAKEVSLPGENAIVQLSEQRAEPPISALSPVEETGHVPVVGSGCGDGGDLDLHAEDMPEGAQCETDWSDASAEPAALTSSSIRHHSAVNPIRLEATEELGRITRRIDIGLGGGPSIGVNG